MFNIDKKYITIGIKEQIGIDIQLFMWNEIEKRINLKKELDYLQVFNISIIVIVLRKVSNFYISIL